MAKKKGAKKMVELKSAMRVKEKDLRKHPKAIINGKGGYWGKTIGSWIGDKLGDAASTMFGSGDYTLKSNSIVNSIPDMHSAKSSIRFTHHEFLTDISCVASASVLNINAWPINPGLSQTFPTLSQFAACFEQYKIHGLVFCFKSTSADALSSTNTALGTVIGAVEYNVLNPLYTTKQAMEAAAMASSSPPNKDQLFPVECDTSQGPMVMGYVRVGSVPYGADKRLYDLGTFQLATFGQQAASVIGELWVTYDVELFKPQLVNGGAGLSQVQDHFSSGQGISTTSYLGTSVVQRGLLGGSWNNSSSTYTFPPSVNTGNFLVIYMWNSSVSAALTVPNVALVNASGGSAFQNYQSSYVVTPAGTTTTAAFRVHQIAVNAPGQSVASYQFLGGVLGTPSYVDFIVMEYPNITLGIDAELGFHEADLTARLQALRAEIAGLRERPVIAPAPDVTLLVTNADEVEHKGEDPQFEGMPPEVEDEYRAFLKWKRAAPPEAEEGYIVPLINGRL